MDKDSLVTLTADIVAAHVSNNNVAVGDIANLVRKVHSALEGLGEQEQPRSEEKTPAVSIRASIKPDHLVCMECGRKQKTLKRHLQTAHGMTPEQYRKDYGLPQSYPMTSPDYSKKRQELAKASGLGRKKRESSGDADQAGEADQAPAESKAPSKRRRKKAS